MADPVKPEPKSFEQTLREMAAKDPSIVETFGGREAFDRTVSKIGGLDTKFQQTGGIFFALGSSPQESAERFTQIHIEQYREGARPSLPALVAHHLDDIGLSKESPHYKAALLVAARAEVDLANTPQYHNKNHYADVTAHVAEFVKKNNELAERGVPGARKLSVEEMADSITAAVAHDIDHPGGKNAAPGTMADASNRLKLEEQSFRAIEPLLKEAGLTTGAIDDIHTMIQTTSPDGPHSILKFIAKAQQEGKPVEWEKIDPNNKMPELRELAEKLAKDPKLTARAAMLEDADLGASAFEGKKSNVVMSEVFTQELMERNYNENLKGPSARQGFSDFVVGEGPASAAAQDALGANYKQMYAETKPIANQMKTLGAGVWTDGVMEGGTPFSRAEATGLNEMQVNGAMKAMKEAGLNPVIETGTEPGKTVFRIEGDDVARLQTMRQEVITRLAGSNYTATINAPVATPETLLKGVTTGPLGNDEIKALKNALQTEVAKTSQPNFRVQGAIPVEKTTIVTAPPPPNPPAGGTGTGQTVAPETPAPVAPKPAEPPVAKTVTPPTTTDSAAPVISEKPPAGSKFMPENKGPVASIMDNPRNAGTGNAGAAGLGIVLGGVGLHDAIERGDTTGGVIASANIATATVQATEGVLTAAGRTAPLVTKVGKFIPGANLAMIAVDGAYQISQEKTTEAKVERGVVVGATTATALLAGTAVATAGEAAVITTGVTAVLGTGAAATGTAAIAVAAAPVVLTVAAAGAVAYTGNAALESKRAWDNVDKQIAENGKPQERQGYKSEDGKPSVMGYKHIAVQLLHHSELLKTENMNGVAGMERDKNGRFKIQDFKKIDMRDPKNIAELERVLATEIAKKDKIIKDNDSIVPKGLRIFSGDSVDKMTMAQMDRADMAGALAELQMYKKKLQEYDAANPGDPATTGTKPPAASTAATKPRAKGPGMG
ncbi:MAG: hypothetical protein ACAH83_20595 [Alphaproteobacteria bacterium]